MYPQEDMIVDISETLEKFFRCSGRMLKPGVHTMESFISEIPQGKIVTIDLMRKELAHRAQVEVTCPYDSKIVLLNIANETNTNVAYWRVLKSNGELNPKFPGGLKTHAALLENDGLDIESTGKTLRVRKYKEYLMHF